MSNNLKPCPFCGGKVCMALAGYESEYWWFISRGISKNEKNCKCRVFMEGERFYSKNGFSEEDTDNYKSDLVNAWNRRATDE